MGDLTEQEVDFLAKVEWEGGIIDALEYGLDEDDLPDGELKDLWYKVRTGYAEIEGDINKLHNLIDANELGR